jgi:hypothetical protein
MYLLGKNKSFFNVLSSDYDILVLKYVSRILSKKNEVSNCYMLYYMAHMPSIINYFEFRLSKSVSPLLPSTEAN